MKSFYLWHECMREDKDKTGQRGIGKPAGVKLGKQVPIAKKGEAGTSNGRRDCVGSRGEARITKDQ